MLGRVRGFTLLEAIVALTIFAASGMALYGWYSTALYGLVRAEEQLQVLEFMHNVDAHLATINLTQEGAGEYREGGLSARWDARLIEDKKDGRSAGGRLSYFELGLYRVDIEVLRDADNTLLDEFSIRMVGFEGVRVPRLDLTHAGP